MGSITDKANFFEAQNRSMYNCDDVTLWPPNH